MYVTIAPVICNENIKTSDVECLLTYPTPHPDPHHAEKPQINVEQSIGCEFNPLLQKLQQKHFYLMNETKMFS